MTVSIARVVGITNSSAFEVARKRLPAYILIGHAHENAIVCYSYPPRSIPLGPPTHLLHVGPVSRAQIICLRLRSKGCNPYGPNWTRLGGPSHPVPLPPATSFRLNLCLTCLAAVGVTRRLCSELSSAHTFARNVRWHLFIICNIKRNR